MSEPTFTNAELQAITGTGSVNVRLRLNGKPFVPGSRPRRWPLSSLPPEWIEPCRRYAAEGAPIPDDPEAAAHARPAPRPASARDQAVADARLGILAALDRWRDRETATNLNQASYRFAELYNRQEIEVEPATRAAVASVSRTRLMHWRSRHRAGGWSALLPRRGGHNVGQGLIDSDPELRDAIVAHVLERPGHVNAKTIQRALRVSFQRGRLPSYRTLQRWLAAWLAENRRLVSAVADPDRHRSRYQPAGGDASAGIARLNQLWELDSTPADVICTDGRHALVGAIDVFSRRARVLVVPTSKAAAIASLLRRAILAWGVPEAVRTDEGADYVSRHLRRALADLGVRHEVLPPFSPEKKPFIERFFGTLSRSVLELLPGFSGHSVAEAQALRSRKSFAARRGEADAEAFKVALGAAELQAACDAWLEAVYEREPHKGLSGRSPFETAAGQPSRRIDDERALDVLLAEPADGGGWRVVQKKGIFAEGTSFIAAALGALVGERVTVKRDPADAGGIYVFDRAGAFVCRAVAPEREGVDRQEIAAAMRQAAKAADTQARAYARSLKRQVKPEAAIEAILAAGRREAAQVVAFPAPAAPHDGPGIRAARDAAAADPGAKPMPTDDPRRLAEEEEGERLRAEARAYTAGMVDLAAARRRAEEEEGERLRAEARAYTAQLAKRGEA
jgi:putative transposase